MTKRKIVITEYNPRWAQMFQMERNRLSVALGQLALGIEHFGSTSVPGLSGKPIIDIMIGVESLEVAETLIKRMEQLGYHYDPEREGFTPERRYFWRGSEARHSHHVSMVEYKGEFWNRYIIFRDYLRRHPDVVREYDALKRELAPRFDTLEEYWDAKAAFVNTVYHRALEEIERETS